MVASPMKVIVVTTGLTTRTAARIQPYQIVTKRMKFRFGPCPTAWSGAVVAGNSGPGAGRKPILDMTVVEANACLYDQPLTPTIGPFCHP